MKKKINLNKLYERLKTFETNFVEEENIKILVRNINIKIKNKKDVDEIINEIKKEKEYGKNIKDKLVSLIKIIFIIKNIETYKNPINENKNIFEIHNKISQNLKKTYGYTDDIKKIKDALTYDIENMSRGLMYDVMMDNIKKCGLIGKYETRIISQENITNIGIEIMKLFNDATTIIEKTCELTYSKYSKNNSHIDFWGTTYEPENKQNNFMIYNRLMNLPFDGLQQTFENERMKKIIKIIINKEMKKQEDEIFKKII